MILLVKSVINVPRFCRSLTTSKSEHKKLPMKPTKIETQTDATRYFKDKKVDVQHPPQNPEFLEWLKSSSEKQTIPFVRDPNFVDY